MPAFFSSTLRNLLTASISEVLGILADGNSRARFPITPEQIEAWKFQLPPLQRAASELIRKVSGSGLWTVLLEYPIPRIGKRIDCVLLARDVIAVLEFKTGISPASGIAQAEDYAAMLRDFHEPSHGRVVAPVAVYHAAKDNTGVIGCPTKAVSTTFPALSGALAQLFARCTSPKAHPIDPETWDSGRFVPVPPIIDAAVALYSQMDVFEIGHACSAHETLELATANIAKAVRLASESNSKLIAFVTGVPGAGKTLVGLNVAHHSEMKQSASFLSGNRPLVTVLREALIRDVSAREKISRARATEVIRTFIHNVHRFADEYYSDTQVPAQHVIVFDEAQRAWNREQNAKKYDRACSEPEMLLDIMARHTDWAAIVALVGGGQEINRGEAGLSEWGRALQARPEWSIWAPPEAINGDASVAGQRLFAEGTARAVHEAPELHLKISVRSIRAKQIAEWVNVVLNGKADRAAQIAKTFEQRPVLTRSLAAARGWLQNHRHGTSRAGLVGSASAARMRADGLEPSYDFHRFFDWENWFLDETSDARASSNLEVHATQFEIQGLELDWVGVCWGEDLVWEQENWCSYRFNNKKWRPLADKVRHTYLVNAYRVLLTRARRGMAIYVPQASSADSKRNATGLDNTAAYLQHCGADLLS